jgi:hypothetical protein
MTSPTVGRIPAEMTPATELVEVEPAETVKEHVSTLLSNVAILAMVVGLTWGLWSHLGPWALCAGGFALAVLVSVTDFARRPQLLPEAEPAPPPKGPPGPTSAGNLHTKGPGAES